MMSASGSQKSQQEHGSPVKIPIILAKHDKQPGGSGERTAGRLWNPAEVDVRLAASPKHGIPTLLQSGELPSPQPAYKIQQRNDLKPPPVAGNDWTKVTSQTTAIKVIDEYMSWCSEALPEFLLEHSDFRVVGILGTEGVGKTHIMNLLATHPKKVDLPFKPDRLNAEHLTGHSTTGLNAYVTSERIILLDCQPIFSLSVLDSIITNDKKLNSYNNSEDMYDAMNMELTMFVLSVCHIVIVAENWFTDPNLHRILQSVEMLKPPQLNNEKPDDHNEFTSTLVFVRNMCSANDLDPYDVGVMEASLTKMYSKSSLRLHRHRLTGDVKLIPLALSQESDDGERRSVCKKLEQRLVQEIMSMHISPIRSHATLSEKNWFQYASKMWDAVRKSPFLSEYMRLLSCSL